MRGPTAVSVQLSEPKAELSLNSALSVVSLVPGGAAERAGVRVGDTLLAVGGAAQQQGDAGMASALAAIKSAPRPVGLVFSRGGDGGAPSASLMQLALLRLFASLVLGIAIFTLVSGGLAVISAALVIAQAATLLNITRSIEALSHASATNGLYDGGGDCGDCGECCSSLKSLRALSIAGIVFPILELLSIFPVSEIFGWSYTDIGGSGSCYCTSIYSYCYVNSYYRYNGFAYWLLYAAGHTVVAAVLHLALSVTVFRLVRLLKSSSQQQQYFRDGGDRQPLVGSAFGDAYLAMDASGGSKPAGLLPPAAMPQRAYGSAAAYVAPSNAADNGE